MKIKKSASVDLEHILCFLCTAITVDKEEFISQNHVTRTCLMEAPVPIYVSEQAELGLQDAISVIP